MAKPSAKRLSTHSKTNTKPAKRRRRGDFNYDQLPPKHIRILQVTSDLKRNGRRKFHSRLRSHHVKTLPHFIALSYAWPPAGTATQPLPCNDEHISIPAHLWNFFESICPTDAACSFAVWIDAICIDQDNDIEKNNQISHMGSVYGLASQVVVWLGLNDAVDKHRDEIERLAYQTKGFLREYWWGDYSKTVFPHPITEVIASMIWSPWFARLWVVQEVCLGRRVNVLCDRWMLPWSTLRNFFDWKPDGVSVHLGDSPEFRACFSHGRAISICKEMHETYSRTSSHGRVDYWDYVFALDQLRSQKCSKPIDRIYGLLFFLPEAVKTNIVVDYSQEAQYWKTYVHLARALLPNISGLSVLRYAPSKKSQQELPSWCPDWSMARDGPQPINPYVTHYNKIPRIRFGNNLRHLYVHGYEIDRIASTIPALRDCRTADEAEEWFVWQLRCFAQLRASLGKAADSKTLLRMHLSNLTYGLWQADSPDGAAGQDPKAIRECDWREIIDCYDELMSHHETIGTAASFGFTDRAHKFAASSAENDRSYFTTQNRRAGRGYPDVRPNDAIVVLYGEPSPFILRNTVSDVQVYRLIGDAYLYGCMEPEMMPTTGRGPDHWFTLV